MVCVQQRSELVPGQATVAISVQSPKCRLYGLLRVVEGYLGTKLPSPGGHVGLEGALVRLTILLVSTLQRHPIIAYCIPPQRLVFEYSVSPMNPKRAPILGLLFVALISIQTR